MNQTEKDILHHLLYFDVFSYPLREEELLLYTGALPSNGAPTREALNSLKRLAMIRTSEDFYYLGGHDEIISRRINGNNKARQRMKAARRYARIISWCPFVRGVFLSGSIAKGFMNQRDDIDYFIVTSPSRLWIARTMLTLFKKVFLLNSYRNFCINYFVDADHLEVHEHNRFTATEIAFLLPVFNHGCYQQMLSRNKWIRTYYPDFLHDNRYCSDYEPLLKRWMEKLTDMTIGNRLEHFLFRHAGAYIGNKFGWMDQDRFNRCFTIKPHELRYLPSCQQSRIMKRYCAKVRLFERRHQVSIQTP